MSTIIFPGLIDPHVHLRDPGQTEKEDFYTGTCAALAGGFTTVLDMPNNKVPVTTRARLQEKIREAKKKIVCDVGFYFGSLTDNFNEFDKVRNKVFGIKLYLNLTTGRFLIDEEKLKNIYLAWQKTIFNLRGYEAYWDAPILVHSEEETVEKVLEVVRKTKKHTHFCHISSEFELQRIIQAKNQGLPITCGVTPHHLFLTENDVKNLGGFGMMKPPLKSKKDMEFLWKNLQCIDVIESDHAPHTLAEKKSATPIFGVPGLETTLPLLLTANSENKISLDEVLRLCFYNPAKIFNIKTNKNTRIEVNLNKTYTIKNENLKTKCRWSPFNGWKVKGKVERVFLRGEKVYEDGRILVQPGDGEIILSN